MYAGFIPNCFYLSCSFLYFIFASQTELFAHFRGGTGVYVLGES